MKKLNEPTESAENEGADNVFGLEGVVKDLFQLKSCTVTAS